MNKRILLIILLVSLVVLGILAYRYAPYIEVWQYQRSSAKIDDFVKDARYQLLNKYGLGKPIKTEVNIVGSVNDPAFKEKSIREKYDGLEIFYSQELKGKEKFLSFVRLTSNKYKLKGGITLGTKRKQVERVLGKAGEAYKGLYIYQSEMLSLVNVRYKNDVVVELGWGYGAP